MEKQEAILQHKIRSIDDKIYDLIQEKKQLQNELDSLGVEEPKIVDSDINRWSEEKKVYFELVGKLNEPERKYALDNFNEKLFIANLKISKQDFNRVKIHDCLLYGFNWGKHRNKFNKIYQKLKTNTYQFDRI